MVFAPIFHCLYMLVLIDSIDEIFGAMVAGMTSEGGGAVAFPVRSKDFLPSSFYWIPLFDPLVFLTF